MRATAAVGGLVLLVACPAPGVDEPAAAPTHRGLDLDGHTVELFLDRAEATWRLSEPDGDPRGEGMLADAEDGWLSGFLSFEGDDRPMYGVDLPDFAVVAELPGRSGEPRMLWAASTSVDVPTYTPLITGTYTLLRVRDNGATSASDYGFATVEEDGGFFMHWRDSADPVFDEMEFGENQTDADSADVAGTWHLGGDHPQDFAVEAPDGDWRGVVYPGWAIVLKDPQRSGLVVALWSPLEHNQQSIYDNIHRHLTVSRIGDVFGPPTPTLIEIFGDEGLLTRIDADGEVEEIGISGRAPSFNVGNVISWVVGDDDQERLFQIQVGDVAAFVTGGACLAPGPPGEGGGDPGEDDECTDEAARFRSYGLGAHFDF